MALLEIEGNVELQTSALGSMLHERAVIVSSTKFACAVRVVAQSKCRAICQPVDCYRVTHIHAVTSESIPTRSSPSCSDQQASLLPLSSLLSAVIDLPSETITGLPESLPPLVRDKPSFASSMIANPSEQSLPTHLPEPHHLACSTAAKLRGS